MRRVIQVEEVEEAHEAEEVKEKLASAWHHAKT